ncbi:MAG: hypothetical protein M3Z26_10680 [Bacteroidota bacterium]|nr:hypothetical protein [Bacteroidota bacterium]
MNIKFKMINLFSASMFLLSTAIYAQHVNSGVQLTHYVFNEFANGTVTMKSGETFNRHLNYNILTNEMIFNSDGKYMAIASPENVDTVNINDRKFIYLNNKFFEMLVNSNIPLLLEFTSSINEPGVSTGYGVTSTTTASTSYKSLVNSGGAYELKLPDGFTVTPGYNYWIKKDGVLLKAGSAKQLIKIFPEKKIQIEELIKKNQTSFSKRDDIISLVKQIE